MIKAKKKILFISLAFPPKFDSESLQVERVFSQLSLLSNYRFSVITSDRNTTKNMPLSKDMVDYSSSCENYIEVPLKENIFINKFFSIFGFINLPDSKRKFFTKGLAYSGRLTSSPDLIYSRSFPPSSAILACKLASKYKVPWVMHLSDPWFLSPLVKFSFVERLYNKFWERRCLSNASKISFTTQETMDLYSSYYPEYDQKFFLSYNSVLSSDLEKEYISSTVSNQVLILYTGVLNRDRDPSFILKTLRDFNSKNSNDSVVRIKFCGPIDRYAKSVIESYSDVTEYLGVIPRAEVSENIKRADFLMAIDMEIDQDKKGVYLISKLLDYAATKKRILCVTNQTGPAVTFLNSVNGACIFWNDIESLKRFFHSAQLAKRENNLDFFEAKPLPNEYVTEEVVSRLVSTFDRCLGQ